MRIIANETKIERRTKIGEIAPFAGLITLVIATVLIFVKPEWMWSTLILVWIGLLISLTGGYLGDRYVGEQAHHRRIPESLKGFDDNYTLLMYKAPVPFVFIEPGGVTVITVKSQAGEVRYEDGRWRHQQKLGWLRRFAGQESLGRPGRLAEAEVEVLADKLDERLPEDVDVPIRPVIVFTHPDVQLHAEEAPIPAVRAAEFKRWLRKNPLDPPLSDEAQAALAEALGYAEAEDASSDAET
jgi:hypothetical protein